MDSIKPDLRVLVTNDIFSAFSPRETSWGLIPGGVALQKTVAGLREGANEASWIDGGDFAGGMFAAIGDGEIGWQAAGQLEIDLAVPGNHEFDFGDTFAFEQAVRMPFQLSSLDLCTLPPFEFAVSNRGEPLVTPSHRLVAPSGLSVEIIGMSLVSRRGRLVYADAEPETRGVVEAVRERVGELRLSADSDPDYVILIIHDGMDRSFQRDFPAGLSRDRIAGLCRELRGYVDAIVGGHSLVRAVETVEGIPYVQPWPMGVEVGVLDFDASGITISAQLVPASSAESWEGPGGKLERELSDKVLGTLDFDLRTPANGRSRSLAAAVATGLKQVSDADIVLISPIDVSCMQPVIDGVAAHIAAGDVSERDIWHALPWPPGELGDGALIAQLAPEEVREAIKALTCIGLKPGVAGAIESGGATVISCNYAEVANRALARTVEWEGLDLGQRDGLRAFVEGGGSDG